VDLCGTEFGEMQQQARATLVREFGAARHFSSGHAEMRYFGRVTTSGTDLGMAATLPTSVGHSIGTTSVHGHARLEGGPRAAGAGIFRRSHGCAGPSSGALHRPARRHGAGPGARDVYFGEAADAGHPVYEPHRAWPRPSEADGPALIEEYGSTTRSGQVTGSEIGELGESASAALRP